MTKQATVASEATGYTTLDDNRTVSGPGGTTYTYDHEGNVTNSYDGQYHWTYTWDHRNRLVEASRSGLTIDYEYDAFNRLIRMNNSQTNNNAHFVYDEGINPIMEYSSSSTGDPRKYYLWSDAVDDLLATQQLGSGGTPGNVLWPLADHLGSIRDIADRHDTTGVTSVTNHRRYDSFGQLKSETNAAVDLVFGYTGKLFDESTGLQNNLNRWYNPNLGKFISQDPIGINSGDANPYRYVGNRATGYVDPLGLADEVPDEVGGTQAGPPVAGAGGSLIFVWPGSAQPISLHRSRVATIGACDSRPMTAERTKQYALAEMEYQIRQAQQHGRSTALLQADLMKMRIRPASPAPLLVAWGPQDAGYGIAWDVLLLAGAAAKGSNPYNTAAGMRLPIRIGVPSRPAVATASLNPGAPISGLTAAEATARNVAQGFPNFQCVACADAVEGALVKSGQWLARKYLRSKKSLHGRWTRFDGAYSRILEEEFGGGSEAVDAFFRLLVEYRNQERRLMWVSHQEIPHRFDYDSKPSEFQIWEWIPDSGCDVVIRLGDGRTKIEGYYSSVTDAMNSAEKEFNIDQTKWENATTKNF